VKPRASLPVISSLSSLPAKATSCKPHGEAATEVGRIGFFHLLQNRSFSANSKILSVFCVELTSAPEDVFIFREGVEKAGVLNKLNASARNTRLLDSVNFIFLSSARSNWVKPS
jgi:hypothetical protein